MQPALLLPLAAHGHEGGGGGGFGRAAGTGSACCTRLPGQLASVLASQRARRACRGPELEQLWARVSLRAEAKRRCSVVQDQLNPAAGRRERRRCKIGVTTLASAAPGREAAVETLRKFLYAYELESLHWAGKQCY